MTARPADRPADPPAGPRPGPPAEGAAHPASARRGAAAARLDTGAGRFRCGPHRGDPLVAELRPVPGERTASPEAVRRATAELARRGYRHVVTPALAPIEQEAYLANGYVVRERLHLLERTVRLGDARPGPTPPGVRLRRATAADRPAVLALDAEAFDGFWRLDDPALTDAIGATPTARFRIARDGDGLVGYAVTGRAGRRGYLQRLAVAARSRRRGVAGALIADATSWLARHGVRSLAVNTQEANDAALDLYRRHGFEPQVGGLAVLERSLAAPAPGPP